MAYMNVSYVPVAQHHALLTGGIQINTLDQLFWCRCNRW